MIVHARGPFHHTAEMLYLDIELTPAMNSGT
ncbi:hypothetical protein QFZ74_000092 [Streptomyces sp. V3I7]|nr:hypothetical protein [Streptomyces sp. V3I7]